MLIYRGEKSLLVYLKKTSNVFLKSIVRSFEHTLKLTWNVRYNMMGYPRLSMERDENTRHIIPCRGAFYMHLGRASGSISNCSSYWCHLTTLQTVSVGADIFDLCIISFSLLFFFPSYRTLHNTPEMYLDHFRSFTPLGFNSIRCSQIHSFFLWDSVVILWSTFL